MRNGWSAIVMYFYVISDWSHRQESVENTRLYSPEKSDGAIPCWQRKTRTARRYSLREKEKKGLVLNVAKTKVMKCEAGFGSTENSGNLPCGVCRKGLNSIKYNQCGQWIHGRCIHVSGKLQNVSGFLCKRCVDEQLFRHVEAMKEILISSLERLNA